MAKPAEPVLAEVKAALQRGDFIEAFKLLRRAIEAGQATLRDSGTGVQANPDLPARSAWTSTSLPPDVLAALQAGRKIDAIRLLRKQTGMDLKASKRTVDEYASRFSPNGLSPGEVPRSNSAFWLVVVLALIAYLLWYAIREIG